MLNFAQASLSFPVLSPQQGHCGQEVPLQVPLEFEEAVLQGVVSF